MPLDGEPTRSSCGAKRSGLFPLRSKRSNSSCHRSRLRRIRDRRGSIVDGAMLSRLPLRKQIGGQHHRGFHVGWNNGSEGPVTLGQPSTLTCSGTAGDFAPRVFLNLRCAPSMIGASLRAIQCAVFVELKPDRRIIEVRYRKSRYKGPRDDRANIAFPGVAEKRGSNAR